MDLIEIREFTIQLSQDAGKILKDFFTSQEYDKQSKGDAGDIVTQADVEVDSFIRKALAAKYPDAFIMTEETTSGDYRPLKEKEWLFIVDPLDGTINFSRNMSHFAVAIGLMHKGVMQLSVVHIPMKDQTYWADADTDGAFLNGKLISASSISAPSEMTIACDWSNNAEARVKMLTILSGLSEKTRRIKCLGSPAVDLCLVARGDLDGYIHTRLRPWDITPAYLVEKAGGKVTNFKQDTWDIFRLDIIACNKDIYEELASTITFTSSEEIK